ncbi:bifunctional serine/threonine-protein kinase/transporter substrate-binding domain-containing protein [Streptomyces decoyicus]|uniref:bifunctional serine/threonine-protein kinase/transporter substrate-binding domain-containing protein n=1 Tax=Streptomyces decoyicus TaxID=249567 RepID=UPI00386506EE|nr:bifunctional serine/threonine-protein kinase/transporter substrate-binding domain-containing protein [Streptomyces decoyicus]
MQNNVGQLLARVGVLVRPLAKHDPQQIGPFRIIGLLGGGGMGRVYLGRAADGRPVAVKTARSELADDRGFRARFAREVSAAQQVGGPFVAPVVDAAPHDDVPWMATEYVPGVSLTDAVHDCGPLPEHAVRLLTAGLLHALTAVHAHGLVHRDLKPSNILLTAEGPRVIDFGIAHSAADTALTTTGTALGTPGFMAPEQLVMTGPKVTGAADVFALGGVIVYAATGGGPYGNADPQVLMYRTVHEEPRLDELPDVLRELAATCLAKDPERRPALPALMARVGAPGPYGDWLPEPVAVQLRRLSAQLSDPRSPDMFAPRPLAEGPADVPYDRLPTRTTADGAPPPPSYDVPPPASTPAPPQPAAPPPGRYGPALATPSPDGYGPALATPPQERHGPAPSPGPSRRRVLAALSVVGVGAGGGALAWVLQPDGGDGGSTSAGGKPGGSRKPAGIGTPSGRLPKELRDKGIVTIGSDIAYPPMEFVRDGKPAGLDVDLANALGRELGLRVKFVNAVFDALLSGLHANRFDLVMSAMTDTKDRQEGRTDGTKTGSGVDLVDYFKAGLVLVVRKGNPEGVKAPGDLSGRKVAVQRGTVARDFLNQLNRQVSEKLKIREFDSPAEVYDDVAKGRSTACLDDFPVAAHTAATRAGGTALELSGEQLEPLLYGVAVAKTNTALRDAVREALDRLIRNGEYTKILKKWHVEDGAVERAVVNEGP